MNMVKLDTEYVFVDATFGLVYDVMPMHNYDLFMVPREVIDNFYELNMDLESTNGDLSYHVRNGLTFDSLNDFRGYLEVYNADRNDGEIRVRYTGDILDDEEISKLASDIVSYHLCSKHRIRNMKKVRHGFVNILLGDK